MFENGISNKMDFQDYKKLSPEERDYFIFDMLCNVYERTKDMDSRFAGKWMETALKWFATALGTVGLGAAATVLAAHFGGNNTN